MYLYGSYDSELYDNSIKLSKKHVLGLGYECVITRGYDGCLYLFSVDEWDVFVEKLNKLPFDKKGRDVRRYFCANAHSTTIANNRIKIPDELHKHIVDELVVVGMIDRIEIWNKSDYETFCNTDIQEFEFEGI